MFVMLRGYYWDKENTTLEFKDEGLRSFESELMKNPPGDASVMF